MSKETLFETGGVRGWLHEPAAGAPKRALVMTHGAGGNAKGEMLIAIARALASEGWIVLRCDLPFRQQRASGPPRPADAAKDREGLREAVEAMRTRLGGDADIPVTLGGHSYGGRQASMLAAEAGPALRADSLFLCSYPLHPPGRPDQLRTQHLGSIQIPALFVHGTKDPFGTPVEMRAAVKLVPGGKGWIEFVEGAGHDLKRGKELGFLKLL